MTKGMRMYDYPLAAPLSLVQLDAYLQGIRPTRMLTPSEAYDVGARRLGNYPTFGHINVDTARWYDDPWKCTGVKSRPLRFPEIIAHIKAKGLVPYES